MKVCDYYRENSDADCIIGGCTDISNVFNKYKCTLA